MEEARRRMVAVPDTVLFIKTLIGGANFATRSAVIGFIKTSVFFYILSMR
jgi:hypothetical protein